MRKYFIVTDIEWDTDGEYVEDLPNEYFFPVAELFDDAELKELDEDFIEDEVVNLLSDIFGFCIFGCYIERRETRRCWQKGVIKHEVLQSGKARYA